MMNGILDIVKTWAVSSAALAVSWMNVQIALSCLLLFLSIFYTCAKLWRLWKDWKRK